MDPDVKNVLFVCTGNSARSVIGEVLLNQIGRGRFRAYSAGSQPRGEIHPLTLATLAGFHMPIDGLRSKSWSEFAAPGAPPLDFVFTVCDSAAGEACPVWPGQPITAHWGLPDPAAVEGTDAVKTRAFQDTAVSLKRRIELLMSLPIHKLDRLAIQREVRDIGTR